jgi:restriction endonuclease Mrr
VFERLRRWRRELRVRDIFTVPEGIHAEVPQVVRAGSRRLLIDGPELAALMIEHGCGVVEEQRFTLKQVDENFFDEP